MHAHCRPSSTQNIFGIGALQFTEVPHTAADVFNSEASFRRECVASCARRVAFLVRRCVIFSFFVISRPPISTARRPVSPLARSPGSPAAPAARLETSAVGSARVLIDVAARGPSQRRRRCRASRRAARRRRTAIPRSTLDR